MVYFSRSYVPTSVCGGSACVTSAPGSQQAEWSPCGVLLARGKREQAESLAVYLAQRYFLLDFISQSDLHSHAQVHGEMHNPLMGRA